LPVCGDIDTLFGIFSEATTAAFFLSAVAAFISLMSSRLTHVMDRIRAVDAAIERGIEADCEPAGMR
jgi:hypothetical protein